MKSEPLKDKVTYTPVVLINEHKDARACYPIFNVGDVKSAVEWLKKSLKDHIIWKSGYNEESVKDIIDQAFPDLQEVKGKRK